jgi:hypothetical protein
MFEEVASRESKKINKKRQKKSPDAKGSVHELNSKNMIS